MLLKKFSFFEEVVKFTTRSPLKGEKDGVDYWFVNKDKYDQVIFRLCVSYMFVDDGLEVYVGLV